MKKLVFVLSLLLLGSFALQAQTDVTFSVDMSLYAMIDFNPAEDEVQMRGSFDGWGDGVVLTDDDVDSIYTVTIQAAPDDVINYKFVYVQGEEINWESDPNREYTVVGTDPNVVDTDYFDRRTADGEDASITFNVDMTLAANGDFNPDTDTVLVAGSFNGWNTAATPMDDSDGDLIYSVTLDTLKGGETHYFKFIWVNTSAAIAWEDDPNRERFLLDGDNTYDAYWNRVPTTVTLADGNMAFKIDLSVMEEVGIFDPAVDSVEIRAGFNGWSNAENSRMNQDFLNPAKWFIDVPFVQEPLGGLQQFKYFVNPDDTPLWTDGYERPLSQGGGNRDAEFEGQVAQEVPEVYYDDVHPDIVVPSGTTIEVTFSIDMTYAQTDLTFEPTTDQVYWIPEQPSFVLTQGWEDSDTLKVVELTDANSDMVYEGTLEVVGPSWNAFEYRYAYVHEGEFVHEPSGYGDFAYRVRYCEMTAPRAFVQPFSTPQDSWLDQEDKSAESELGPVGINGLREIDPVANTFELSQNYPNPFNPTTLIRFSIPEAGNVSLKIYNVLGQEVMSLINEEMAAGSYEADFNAANFSSGVYFYTLQAGDFTSTKKMMLLK